MTEPILEDMTKAEIAKKYGVSENQTKSEMIAEVQPILKGEVEDAAVLRAREYRSLNQ